MYPVTGKMKLDYTQDLRSKMTHNLKTVQMNHRQSLTNSAVHREWVTIYLTRLYHGDMLPHHALNLATESSL